MRVLIALLLSACALASPSMVQAHFRPHLRPIVRVESRPVCTRGAIRCDAVVVTRKKANASSAVTPAILRRAYSLPADLTKPQTVAVVLWGNDATLNADMAAFDAQYGLPACSTDNGCLTEVNQQGQAAPLPGPEGADVEWALDTQTIHGLCPSCKIVLVEANAATSGDLAMAENTAATLANEVNNSWGSQTEPTPTSADAAFNHSGVAITVSSGDSNYGAQWPANLPTVISVGGTTLQTATDGSYARETVWSSGMNGTGSGCSAYYLADSWQRNLPNWVATDCGSNRAIADVSADADPATGLRIYAQGSWVQVGGTSLASPITAAVIALAGGLPLAPNASSVPYAHQTDGSFHDVVSGSNGPCGTIMCQAAPGYDGPAGLGSPNGVTGFQVGTNPPTPSPTATATPVPPTPTATIPPPPPTPTATPKPHPKGYCRIWARRHGVWTCLWWHTLHNGR